jgi:hypothetical protein
VGGLIGWGEWKGTANSIGIAAAIATSYNVGNTNGTAKATGTDNYTQVYIGRIGGQIEEALPDKFWVVNTYYLSYKDQEICGMSNLDFDALGDDSGPRTSAQLKNQNTFTNWAFDSIWKIVSSVNSGYPILQYFPQGCGCGEPNCICTSTNCDPNCPACKPPATGCGCGEPNCICNAIECDPNCPACKPTLTGCGCGEPDCICSQTHCDPNCPSCKMVEEPRDNTDIIVVGAVIGGFVIFGGAVYFFYILRARP